MSQNTSADPRTLEEYASLEFILVGDLRDLLAEPPDAVTCHWLRAVLDELLVTLPNQFRLRQEGGFLADVLEQYPWWYSNVEQLREEHRVLYDRLRELRGALDHTRRFAHIADIVRRDLKDWMTRLVAYHRHERRLLQNAYTLDVGALD